MTAEVAILNRSAVAIAADSAVTTGGSDPKVYNTANKLFALSALEPVAVMVYGAGAFGAIPWETVVKEYRRRLSSASFATVGDYAEDFIQFLRTLITHVSANTQRAHVANTARWELARMSKIVQESIERLAAEGEEISEPDLQAMLIAYVETRIEELNQLERVEGLTESLVDRELNAAVDDWSSFVEHMLDDLPIASAVHDRTKQLVRSSLRVVSDSPWSSGVVVAGFGRSQLFPALAHHAIDGVVANRLRSRCLDNVAITDESSALIYPFAQKDMVHTFMNGVHPEYHDALHSFVDEVIQLFSQHFGQQTAGLLAADAHQELTERIQRARADTTAHFQNRLEALLQKKSWQPIMSTVGVLPKEELAEMAEALVNLTSFRQRVTPETETVGGPIDVAIISKGDGLVWIKRKHYFTPELNFRYFERDRSLRSEERLGRTQ